MKNLEAANTVGNIKLKNTIQILQNQVAVRSAQRGKEDKGFPILYECDFELEVKQLDEVTTDLRSELQGKSEQIRKMTTTMCSLVDKVEGLQVRVDDWEMEDLL